MPPTAHSIQRELTYVFAEVYLRGVMRLERA